MAYFALIATDPADHDRVSADLREILATFPTATAVSIPAAAPTVETSKVETSQASKPAGTDAAARAREVRSLYAAFAKANGRKPTDAEKQAIKAGQTPVVQPELPSQPEPAAVDVEALLAQMRAQLTGQPVPAAQSPQPAAAAPKAQRFDSLPQSASLTPAVCAGLREWAGNLTPMRQKIVTAYAEGKASAADVHMVYGDKVTKVVSKINQLIAS